MIQARSLCTIILLCLGLDQAGAQPLLPAPNIDKAGLAQQVRTEFLGCWNAYKEYAWGHDELKPLSKGYYDWDTTVSVYMTPVDAMDALTLLGFNDEAVKTRDFVARNLSFHHDIYVKNFEITIRLLGGLVSNYQLSGDKRLLDLAGDLGERLLPVFNSPTGMPYTYVNLKTGGVRGPETNPAEIGTLLIEFGTLSKLTGKYVYYDKAKRALVELYKRRAPIGLVGSEINVETGAWIDSTSHVSGGIDSYYEYLLKCWRLFDDNECREMWRTSVEAVHKYLAHDTTTGFWYSQVNMFTGQPIGTHYGALDAFFPAVPPLSANLDPPPPPPPSPYTTCTTLPIHP